jgi:DNA-binding GntR family transcriptional regulator
VIPLYALYFIRRSHNREGLFQTVSECVEHQDKILQAFERQDMNEARSIARDFLVRMKEALGKRLLPTT